MTEAFGDYTLLRRLGTGGMAELFLARRADDDGGPVLALKRVLPHLSRNRRLLKLFVNEARVAAQLNHPNIARIHDAGRIGERDYIAMEFVPGPDLARLSQRCGSCPPGTLGFGAIVRVVSDVCAALHHAHEHCGIVHDDIHPRNVLLTLDGISKVIDFGTARAIEAADHARPMGTYAYMAPERHKGEPHDHRGDVFSVGVVLWELLTGHSLFRRTASYLTLTAVVEQEAPPVRRYLEQVGPEATEPATALDELLARALAKDPGDRFASCAEFADQLLEVAGRYGWDVSQAELAGRVQRLFPSEHAALDLAVRNSHGQTVQDWLRSVTDETNLDWLLDN